MRRYRKEHQWRRRLPGLILTLRCESVGSKKIKELAQVNFDLAASASGVGLDSLCGIPADNERIEAPLGD